MTEGRSPSRRLALTGAASAALGSAALAGCSEKSAGANRSEGLGGPSAPVSDPSSSTRSIQAAQLEFSPSDGAAGVLPTTGVTVTARTGKIKSVKVITAGGNGLPGKLVDGTWTSAQGERIWPSSTYTISVEAEGPTGDADTQKATFASMVPGVSATFGINYRGLTVGVGMPATVLFDSAVSSEFRAEVQRRVSITNSAGVTGSWGWLDGRQLMWRPREFWPPGTSMKIYADLHGVQTGPGKWCTHDAEGSMQIGRSQISTVNMRTYRLTVTRGGAVLRNIPVSTGRPGPKTETRSGTKVIITKEPSVWMDSTTIGIPKGKPGYYRKKALWDLRVTWTGEYLHSAPWSVSDQGTSNVSHGCTNMSPADAQWMYSNSLVGDPVRFVGSNRTFLPTEGIGVWQYSWAGWQRQSAL